MMFRLTRFSRIGLVSFWGSTIIDSSAKVQMFSGLVESKTDVVGVEAEPGGICLVLRRPSAFADIAVGDSIATAGCCLTIVNCDPATITFQAGHETLSKTTLGKLGVGSEVNNERALALGDRLGGHLVTGHVDGVGKLVARVDQDGWSDMTFDAPHALLRQMADKGSVAVDGVSLTLVTVTDTTFSVAAIPHTLERTTLGLLTVGDRVNLETDLLAKYVQRQLETQS